MVRLGTQAAIDVYGDGRLDIFVRYMPNGVVTGEDVDCRSRIYHQPLALE